MKTTLMFAAGLAVVTFLTGCETVPPGVERGPHGTIAYQVLIEASEPGAIIEVNGERVGQAPLNLKIFGDKDGTFHDFGSYYYVIKALPITTNQYQQTRVFMTGRMFTPQDRIPQRIYFDMNQPAPVRAPGAYDYPHYYSPPPVYYGPPVYYYTPGPAVEFHFGGPRFRPPHHRRW